MRVSSRSKYFQHISSLLIILLFVTSTVMFTLQISPTRSFVIEEPAEELAPQYSFIASYVSHSPIIITGNADFASQGFLGSGSEELPYVIEGYNITTAGTCIIIQNTDVCFVIRNCLLIGGIGGKGIDLHTVINGEIRNNTISDSGSGVYLYSSSDNTVVNNSISENYFGVHLFSSSSNNMVLNNSISGSINNGVVFYSSSDNTVANNTISGNGAGVYIDDSLTNTIVNNVISGNVDIGVAIGMYSSTNIVSSNTVTGNPCGVLLWYCSDNMVSQNNFSENSDDGIRFGNLATNNTVEYNTITRSGTGVRITQSWNNTLHHNIIFGNHIGVHAEWASSNNTVTSNTMIGNEYGVLIYSTSGIEVVHNNISESSSGVTLTLSTDSRVANNNIFGNDLGVSITQSSYNNTIVNNNISENTKYGVEIIESSDNTVVYNTLLGNSVCGITISFTSSNNLMYLNSLINTENKNAGDSGTDNHWNSSALGNYWSDYTGTGVYEILGNGIDYHPLMYPPEPNKPTIDSPEDMEYREGTTGHSITWTPNDASPSHYVVYRNGTQVVSDSWNGTSITVEVDNLTMGVYNYTIVVYDAMGNYTSDTVYINVQSSTTLLFGFELSLVLGMLSVFGVIVVVVILKHRKRKGLES